MFYNYILNTHARAQYKTLKLNLRPTGLLSKCTHLQLLCYVFFFYFHVKYDLSLYLYTVYSVQKTTTKKRKLIGVYFTER